VSPSDQSPWVQIPFRRGGIWQPSKLTFLPPAADVATPNARPWVAYIFRAGGYWQPSKLTLLPAPAVDVAPPNQPPLLAYVFRAGGYWQVNRVLPLPPPPDVAVPNAPILQAYRWRPMGKLWTPSRMVGLDAVAPAIIVIPPPATATPGTGGAIYIQVGDRKIRVAEDRGKYKPSRLSTNWREIRYHETLAALFAAGIISDEEFAMLEAAE
jgi:hypothetical protein